MNLNIFALLTLRIVICSSHDSPSTNYRQPMGDMTVLSNMKTTLSTPTPCNIPLFQHLLNSSESNYMEACNVNWPNETYISYATHFDLKIFLCIGLHAIIEDFCSLSRKEHSVLLKLPPNIETILRTLDQATLCKKIQPLLKHDNSENPWSVNLQNLLNSTKCNEMCVSGNSVNQLCAVIYWAKEFKHDLTDSQQNSTHQMPYRDGPNLKKSLTFEGGQRMTNLSTVIKDSTPLLTTIVPPTESNAVNKSLNSKTSIHYNNINNKNNQKNNGIVKADPPGNSLALSNANKDAKINIQHNPVNVPKNVSLKSDIKESKLSIVSKTVESVAKPNISVPSSSSSHNDKYQYPAKANTDPNAKRDHNVDISDAEKIQQPVLTKTDNIEVYPSTPTQQQTGSMGVQLQIATNTKEIKQESYADKGTDTKQANSKVTKTTVQQMGENNEQTVANIKTLKPESNIGTKEDKQLTGSDKEGVSQDAEDYTMDTSTVNSKLLNTDNFIRHNEDPINKLEHKEMVKQTETPPDPLEFQNGDETVDGNDGDNGDVETGFAHQSYESDQTEDEPMHLDSDFKKQSQDVGDSNSYVHDRFVEAEDSHFFAYFMTMVVLCIIGYLVFHNKQKILALAVEGRSRRGTRRRPNTSGYRKLDSNLEEAVTSTCSTSVTHVIY